MKRAIGHFVGSKRNCAVVAGSGKAKISIAEAAGLKTGYSGSAKNARVNTAASVTSRSRNLGEQLSEMRIVTGSLMGSGRSYATNAEGGKRRVTSTGTTQRGTA
ncbi:MAG: hypothetical protein ISS70_10945 [Phycisphaerae bacterium]|nr:hypothetical protein [Phycisphaerae bacterium]